MASLLCGFTPMQSEAKEYKIGGMYTYDYHDGRHADWGEYELHAAKMAIEDINASGMLGGNTLNMPPELVIDYHCWPEGAAEKARSLLKQNIVALTGVDCSGPAVLIAKEAEKFRDSCGVRRRQRRKPELPHRIPLLLPQRDSEHQI